MDLAGRLRRRGADSHRPRVGLLRTERVEGLHTERLVGGTNHAIEGALTEPQSLEQLFPIGRIESGGLLFELSRHDDDRVPVRNDLPHRRRQFSFGSIFSGVDHPDGRLQRQRGQVAEGPQRLLLPRMLSKRLARLQNTGRGGNGLGCSTLRWVRRRLLADLLAAPLEDVEICKREFEQQLLGLCNRIGPGLVGRHFGSLERPQNHGESFYFAQTSEELSGQSPTMSGFGHRRQVEELELRVHGLRRTFHCGRTIESLIGDGRHSDIRLMRGKGMRGGRRGQARQRIEQGGLPHVGEAEDADLRHAE